MNQGNTYTLKTLLDRVKLIEIPIIQRDYVQGRDGEMTSQIRHQFVQSLLSQLVLSPEQLHEPLDLDFIYGSINASGIFCPLDGQQRLTTLFLLHWYLANYDNQFNEFRQLMHREAQSRFGYQTRTSSRIFFNQLIHTSLDVSTLPTDKGVSNALRNQKWFFVTLGYDPTVQSALNMLDTIHSTLAQMDQSQKLGLYSRLISEDTPYITFQFLDLNEFNLSDDLYIKMNGRGKPLTPFENFKAKFEQTVATLCKAEQHRTGVSLLSYINQKMDGQWTDLFWTFSEGNTQKLDSQQVQFFQQVIGVLYPLSNEARTDSQIKDVLSEISGILFLPTHYNYEQLGCFDSSLIKNFVRLMDQLCGSQGELKTYLSDSYYYNERSFFESVISGPNLLRYSESVQFFAWCLFLLQHDDIEPDALFDWTRITHNLVQNTRFNEIGAYTTALLSLRNLVKESSHVLQYFAQATESLIVQGFDRSQVREEQIKAQLILRSEDWKLLIYQAEKHAYFKGQIEFLLDFSGIVEYFNKASKCDWTEEQDLEIKERFTDYLKKSVILFDTKRLNSNSHNKILERAILTKGNYLLPQKRNFSFLLTYDRDISWKRLLRGSGLDASHSASVSNKRKYIKYLMDSIQTTDPQKIDTELKRIIEHSNPVGDWRDYVIPYPEVIQYCKESFVRHDEYFQHTLLLKRSQTNGAHLELRTFHLYLSEFKNSKPERLAPFCTVHAKETNAVDSIPSLQFYTLNTTNDQLKQCNIFLSIEFYLNRDIENTPQFWAKLWSNEGYLPEQLTHAINNQCPEYKDDLTNPKRGIKLNLDNPTADIDKLLGKLAQIIAQIDSSPANTGDSHD